MLTLNGLDQQIVVVLAASEMKLLDHAHPRRPDIEMLKNSHKNSTRSIVSRSMKF